MFCIQCSVFVAGGSCGVCLLLLLMSVTEGGCLTRPTTWKLSIGFIINTGTDPLEKQLGNMLMTYKKTNRCLTVFSGSSHAGGGGKCIGAVPCFMALE